MENKIYIVGENHDKDLLEPIVSQLTNKGYNVSLFLYNQIQQNWEKLIQAERLIIGLSPNCKMDLYNLSSGRLISKKRSINLFLNPTQLNSDQKNKIGRNKSVFKNLYGDATLEALDKIITSPDTWDPIYDFFSKPQAIPNNVETSNYDYDEKEGDSKKKIWMGLIFAACIIGFRIRGYSAYVESAQKKAEENLWNAWDEYLHTEAGIMFATLGHTLTSKDFDEFRQYGFENFIEGKIEPSKDVSWYDIGPEMEGITLSYTTPVDIKILMTDDLLQAYNDIENTSYNEEFWNPVITLERSGYFTINHIKISGDGKSGIITYVPLSNMDSQSLVDMSLCLQNGKWKIDDFINNGINFTTLIYEYMREQELRKELLYIGNVYTSSGLIPISLQINYRNLPELTALYENISQKVKFEMTGEFQDNNINLHAKDNPEICFDLKMEGEHILNGTFSVEGDDGEVIGYEVLLKEEGKEGV